jgi:hypothetical protein
MHARLRLGLTVLVLSGCEAPFDATFEPTPAARDAQPPRLTETADFEGALERATPDAERLSSNADTLAARAAALRARAAALGTPVLAPAERDRLRTPGQAGDADLP